MFIQDDSQNTVYGITDAGANMLNVLVSDLRLSFQETVDAYLKEHKDELELESQLVGEYIKLAQNEIPGHFEGTGARPYDL